MLEQFRTLHPLLQALIAGSFTWVVTALGAAGVILFHRKLTDAVVDAMLGFASGIMLAACYWSLLSPAIDLAAARGTPGWIPAATGVVAGALALALADRWLPHLHPGLPVEQAEGVRTRWSQSTLLVLAITLHNIPEGLAVGVAFGGAAAGPSNDAGLLAGAIALALGIGLQNFPEGVAVALPLRAAGASPWRSFLAGTLSGIVEPIAAVGGAAAVLQAAPLLPYALAFAAGAMLYVVVEELIPEAQQRGRTDLATGATVVGFTVMMILDVALG